MTVPARLTRRLYAEWQTEVCLVLDSTCIHDIDAITALLLLLITSLYPSLALDFPSETTSTGFSAVHLAVVLKADLATVHLVEITVPPAQSMTQATTLPGPRTTRR